MLGLLAKLRIQRCQGALQNFTVARILSSFKLLEHVLAGQQQTVAATLAVNLRGSQRRLRRARSRNRLRLLLLDGFALPSPCHIEIISRRTGPFCLGPGRLFTRKTGRSKPGNVREEAKSTMLALILTNTVIKIAF